VIALVFGPPGSGKGTQAKLLARSLKLPHVSTGEILRQEAGGQSELARQLAPILAEGSLVPDDLIVQIIDRRLQEDDAQAGVLLDGFPRTVEQARALDGVLRRTGARVDLVLSLTVGEDHLIERLLRRAREEDRADDTPETIRHRMREYEAKTAPVVDYYSESGVRVERVNGEGEVQDVYARVRKVLEGVLDGRTPRGQPPRST
jgi:adenylate kinase